jgi:hypothetical protein
LDFGNIINKIDKKRWNVYAKAPFGGPGQVVEYLGRYTHKIAITKHRIVQVTIHTLSLGIRIMPMEMQPKRCGSQELNF